MCASVEDPPQLADLGQRLGNTCSDYIDLFLHERLRLHLVGFGIGGDDVLVNTPRCLHFNVLLIIEGGEEAIPLLLCVVFLPGMQCVPGRVERVTGASAMTARGLLNASAAVIRCVAGKTDNMERVHDRDRLWELFCGRIFEAGETVHRNDFNAITTGLWLAGEPGSEDLFRAPFDPVKEA